MSTGEFNADMFKADCYGVTRTGFGVAGVIGGINPPASAVGMYGQAGTEDSPFDIGFAGLFRGTVGVVGQLIVFGGGKSAAVKHSDGSHRLLYCMESPESWFEDFGEAKLVNGKVHIKLDPGFGAVIQTDSFHVFVSGGYGSSCGLYVSKRSRQGFVQENNGGKSNLTFSNRIVGKRKDVRAKRFAKVVLPKLRKVPTSPISKFPGENGQTK